MRSEGRAFRETASNRPYDVNGFPFHPGRGQPTMQKQAAFLDLNGTLVMPVQVQHPTEHWIIPGAIEAVRLLNQHGFLCPVVTVQTRIAKGYFSVADFATWFQSVVGHFRSAG